ncbi:hypothetical protein ILYODFUR_039066 [Ilyodon furcidens]|uniref:Uncharacterized protein n=1 Tax=Ilyodon furcidens TaxID=33524 RepID=A0ABV0U394_9TELE
MSIRTRTRNKYPSEHCINLRQNHIQTSIRTMSKLYQNQVQSLSKPGQNYQNQEENSTTTRSKSPSESGGPFYQNQDQHSSEPDANSIRTERNSPPGLDWNPLSEPGPNSIRARKKPPSEPGSISIRT